MNELDVFAAALELNADRRTAYLDEACGPNSELRQRIENLLQMHEKAGDFFEKPAAEIMATEPTASISEKEGESIGPYKLLQQVGEGGMGVVYMAEQTKPVKRRVAVKIIKPGMDSRQVIARFEAERQALALMDHPNIAKVLDAATTDSGQPYFVMELVKGVPVTQYCDEQHLTPKERLALFIPICQAVQHAHQKGIIHRDLKPSNILVALYDGQPVPKVIDFGVAKATSQQLTDKTMFTQLGQIVGTLEYMSPEQAQVNQLDVDTRSDIYSLGVLLYELLTGATPLDRKRLQSAAFDEMMRIIREEEPPRPSMRLSTIDTLPSVAANRRIEPKKLRTLIRGELDWIVMKALEKDRARRYETANGFAVDIQRYLDDEPVVACPPSAGYRFRKFARRHKAMSATITAIAVAILFGLAGTTWQAIRATRAEADAQKERDVAADERDHARAAELRATNEADRARRALRKSKVMRLAAQAQSIHNKLPARSLLLSIEAVKLARRHDGAALSVAHGTLLNATSDVGGVPLTGHRSRIWSLGISPDGRWAITGSLDNTARLWDLHSPDPAAEPLELRGHEKFVLGVVVGPKNRWAMTSGKDGTARLWDLTARDPSASPFVLDGHTGGRHSVAISADGDWAVDTGVGNVARLWDLTVEDPSSSSTNLPGHEAVINAVAISPNSRWLLTASDDKTARLWDLSADDPAQTHQVLRGHEDRVRRVAIGPASRWAVTASHDKTARLWDLTTETPATSSRVLPGHNQLVVEAAFTSDGHRLVTGDEGNARIWDLTAAEPEKSSVVLGPHPQVGRVTLSPDDRWLVTSNTDQTAQLWDLTSEVLGLSSLPLRGHEGNVSNHAISSDGRWLVTSSWDGTARLWDLTAENPASSRIVPGQSGPVAVSPDSRWLFRWGAGTPRLWDLTAGELASPSYDLVADSAETDTSTFRPSRASAAISPDSHWLATGSEDGRALVWDLTSNDPSRPVHVLTHDKGIRSITIGPDNRWLVTGCEDGVAHLWDLRLAEPESTVRSLPGHDNAVVSVAISRNNRWLASGSDVTRLWDLTADNPRNSSRTLTVPEASEGGRTDNLVTISSDGRWLAVGTAVGDVSLWELTASDPFDAHIELQGQGDVIRSVTISEDSRWLAVGGWSNKAVVWDLKADDPRASMRQFQHQSAINSVLIIPNGRWLVTACEDSTVHLWNLSASDPKSAPIVLGGHERSVSSMAASGDSRWLVTGSSDSMRLWDLDIDSLLGRAHQLAGRELTELERLQYLSDEQ